MPSESQVDKAMALIEKGGGNYEYFFAALSKPSWIGPLAKRGRFNHPPPLQRVSESAYRIPAWPEGQYLLRMAALAPGEVANAIGPACFTSDNPLVHTNLIEIALLLDATDAREVALKEVDWLSHQRSLYTLYPNKAAALVLHLLEVGELTAALRLTNALLKVRAPEPRTPGKQIELEDGSTYTFRHPPDPEGLIEPAWAQMFLSKVLSPLATAAGPRLLEDLAQNLDAAVSIHSTHHEDKTEDYSTVWRPYLDHRTHQGTLDEVVSALTDSVSVIVDQVPGSEPEILRIFAQYKWKIFARLSAFTLKVAKSLDTDVLVGHLSDLSLLLRDPYDNPEFSDLLTSKALQLPKDVLEKLLEHIAKGPDLTGYEERWAKEGYPDEVEARRAGLIGQWQLHWLACLRPALPEEFKNMLEQLETSFRPIQHHRQRGKVMAVQEQSPADIQTFKQMSITHILQYLKEWAPSPAVDPFNSPSRSGLGTTLSEWVSDDPARASSALDKFLTVDLDPVYISSMLDSFTSLLKEGIDFDVYAVADAARWVAQNTDATQPASENQWDRATWNWAHMSAARFMSELMLKTERIDLQRANELFECVKALCFVPRPTQEDEADYRKQSSRYASFALNTPRPVGVEAMIRFGRWIKVATPPEEFSRDSIRQVLVTLAEKMDHNHEPSVGVREMLGMQFGLLAWLDIEWFNSVIPKLFPGKRAEDRFPWNAYLLYGRMVIPTLPAMRDRYMKAINKLETASTNVEETDRILANHLIRFYASGAIGYEDPLLTEFFSKASPALRKQAFGDIGWSLGHEEEEVEERVRARFIALADHRWQALKDAPLVEAKELESFGWWINCRYFPVPWTVERAMQILEKVGSLDPDFAVAESFASLANDYPYEAVRAVHVLLMSDKDGWSIHGWNQHLDSILRTALVSGERAKKEAKAMIDSLAARGFRGYRSLLNVPTSSVGQV